MLAETLCLQAEGFSFLLRYTFPPKVKTRSRRVVGVRPPSCDEPSVTCLLGCPSFRFAIYIKEEQR